ncbi:MAG: strawberry notch-like NTP hydrolase domain-containing protein, partial [Syntrophobacteraceae bacterium]
MAICPEEIGLHIEENRKDWNDLLEKLGGKAMSDVDVRKGGRQAYKESLTPEQERAYYRAYAVFSEHEGKFEQAHGYADAWGKAHELLETKGEQILGTNAEGQTVGIDAKGNRYVTDGKIRRSAPVGIVPGRGGVGTSFKSAEDLHREGRHDFLTKEELDKFEKAKTPTEPKKPKTPQHKPGFHDYQTYTTDGRIVIGTKTVSGKPVKLDIEGLDKKHQFFTYQDESGGWFVVEASTGTSVAGPEKGMHGAIHAAEVNMEDPERLAYFEKYIKEYDRPLLNQGETPIRPEVEGEKAQSPSQQIADWVKAKLASSDSEYLGRFVAKDLFDQADKAFGGTQAQGKYTVKDAYDAMEMGINQHIAEMFEGKPLPDDVKAAQAQIDQLQRILNRIPTQTKRTAEMDEFQQFSTPPPLAYLANWAAKVSKKDTVLEPSAGVGGLATFAKAAGAKVHVNEYSGRRADLLDQMDFERVTRENAEQIHNILPKDVKPSVVLMNPPFSSTAGRMEGTRNTKNAERHVTQALDRLEPGGRLVAIVGRGMSLDAPTFREFWNKLGEKYNIMADIGISGKNYTKYGTSFDNRLIVIDKTPKMDYETVKGSVEDVKDALPLLEGVRDARATETAGTPTERPAPSEQPVRQPKIPPAGRPPEPGIAEPVGVKVPETTEGETRPQPSLRAPTDVVGAGHRPGGGLGQPSSGNRPIRDTEPPAGGVGRPDQTPGAWPGGRPPQPSDQGIGKEPSAPGVRPSKSDTRPAPDVQPNVENIKKKVEKGELTEALYDQYKPSIKVTGTKPHPGNLVESAAMSSVDAPTVTYKPSIDSDILESGKISDAQMESIVRAGQAHEKILEGPEGHRQGYFIGDGTGVGKGREIAGIIHDNAQKGRKKSLWISANTSLIKDARRDVSGIGDDPEKIIDLGKKIKLGSDIKAPDGTIFTTYSTLKSQSQERPSTKPPPGSTFIGKNAEGYELFKDSNGPFYIKKLGNVAEEIREWTDASKRTPNDLTPVSSIKARRIDQIVNWLGNDFDGVVVFDESHKMANAHDVRGDRGTKKASQTALVGMELQDRLPKARIVYVSATGATEVTNLAYAKRLGLWGPGTAFPNVGTFISKIAAGGVASMEIVSRDMKAMGKYLARSLSYHDVTYERAEHKLTSHQREIYDEIAGMWQIVLQNLNQALDVTGSSGKGGGAAAAKSAFWGANQRFFNQVITSMQMPTILERVSKDIEEGRSPVMQLVNTNEAGLNRALANLDEDEELEDLDMTPRDQLAQYLQRSFPVYEYEEVTDQNGNTTMQLVTDSNGNPVENPEAVRMREELLDRLGSIRVPDGPLEMIMNHLGADKVAEVTGRTQRVVYDKEGKRVRESRTKAKTEAEAEQYMAGQKDALVFSSAGGTGLSYHADKTAGNQLKRVHYLVQPGWRADVAVQGFGRTHRT